MASAELSQKYQKKTDKQHVLDNPDTYIGSVEKVGTELWLYRDGKIVQEMKRYIPGLYKLFDEGIVNCRDHAVRMAGINPVTYMNIDIDERGVITMTNDGDGIDVAMHPEHKVYIPELIFGHLRTSTNYDKNEKKIVGGKNGFGFKLVLIWSEWGMIETVDAKRKLKYTQNFANNLDITEAPNITKCTRKPYTKITFKPDYKRLGMEGLDDVMSALFKRRIYDMAAITDKKCKVRINGEEVPVRTFPQYIDLYIGPKDKAPRVYETSGERWEYALCLAPNEEFMQVSFVNGIHTGKGGKHVDHVFNQIIRKLCALIKKKKKVDVKPSTLKEQLMLFLNCTIENPSFDSQTKDFLNTPSNKFGSACDVSEKFIEKVAMKSGLGVMDVALSLTQVKENASAKKTDGNKTRSVRGIPKLVDANWAGTAKSHLCTLILCEGDSAKAGVVSGLTKDDRNIYGVYPMRGKLLNVRDEAMKKIGDNKEIHEMKQIMGLETAKEYTLQDVQTKLRYSRIVFMTDQDLDGSHIKGLGINLFESLWASLASQPEFLGFMNTPIIKATKGKAEQLFYNEGQYTAWKQGGATQGWTIKYYKGLGTSTAREFKEYFKDKRIVHFAWGDKSADCIDKVFNKKRADDRKAWLGEYSRDSYVDTDKACIGYEEFVDREMIHFSKYDCDRSIPNMVDGLKKSQRKILFAAFKRKLTKEIKVAQFSGYVSEHSAYHHGEASLNGAIVGMAQDYMGSNNINLLLPKGQFGTRLQGGKDSASERYIFTQLNPATRVVFPSEDDATLRYLDDDGTPVEPVHYVPILPMVLVNGCKGIGTGFSTEVPSYDPAQIAEYLRRKMLGASTEGMEFLPSYRGFRGTVTKTSPGKFLIRGLYALKPKNVVHITELPVGTWTDDYKQFLEGQIADKKGIVKDYEDNSTDTVVDITVRLTAPVSDVEKSLRLSTTRSTSNMHLFTEKEQLKKYSTVEEIMDDFYRVRLAYYGKRKTHLLNSMAAQLHRISNKVQYIQGTLDGSIDLRRKSSVDIDQVLVGAGLERIDDSFHYLVKMPMDSVSTENVDKLLGEEQGLEQRMAELNGMTSQAMWLKELGNL